MGRRLTTDRCEDRESYSLSAGLALGLVTLGGGGSGGGSGGRAGGGLDDRLHRLMIGGRAAGGEGVLLAGAAAGDGTRSSRVWEGDQINTSVTAPGATLALGLCFLMSNDSAAAARLALPDTHPLLDLVR